MENNNQQNQSQPTFWQKNFWGIIAVILFFLLIFQIKSPLYIWLENKKTNEIVEAINRNGDKINTGLNDLGKKIGGKIDTTNNISREILDTLKEIKKDTKKISEKECCRERKPKCPPKHDKPAPCLPPVVVKPPCFPSQKPKCDTCIVVKKPCEYVLWNPDRTQRKVFATAEARKEFADAHGLIIHVEDN